MSHYSHLSTNEREKLLVLQTAGAGIREISRKLGRSASTISRELKRNSEAQGYWPSAATERYKFRRQASRRKRKLDEPERKAFVQRMILENQWSPEEIDGRTALEESPFHCSYATIYRAINGGRLETEKLSHGQRGIARKLRHRGKTRHRKNQVETRGKLRISHPIEERPEAANKRSEIGHYEADTVAGKTGSSCLITLADRLSRFLMTKKIPKKTASFVRDGMIEMLRHLPAEAVRSVTPDRGMEFARHAEITEALNGLPFYFPPPHAPWARGTNENTNGLIREYSPKSVDLELLTDDDVAAFTLKLNLRPRKCLGWKSPWEVFFHSLLHLT